MWCVARTCSGEWQRRFRESTQQWEWRWADEDVWSVEEEVLDSPDTQPYTPPDTQPYSLPESVTKRKGAGKKGGKGKARKGHKKCKQRREPDASDPPVVADLDAPVPLLFPTWLSRESGSEPFAKTAAQPVPPWIYCGVDLLRIAVGEDFQLLCTSFTPRSQGMLPDAALSKLPSKEIKLPEGAYAVVRCAGEQWFRAIVAQPAAIGEAAGHAGLAAEEPVVFAGELVVGPDNRLTAWTSVSGTYQIPDDHVRQSMLPLTMFWRCVHATDLHLYAHRNLRPLRGGHALMEPSEFDDELERELDDMLEAVSEADLAAMVAQTENAIPKLDALLADAEMRAEAGEAIPDRRAFLADAIKAFQEEPAQHIDQAANHLAGCDQGPTPTADVEDQGPTPAADVCDQGPTPTGGPGTPRQLRATPSDVSSPPTKRPRLVRHLFAHQCQEFREQRVVQRDSVHVVTLAFLSQMPLELEDEEISEDRIDMLKRIALAVQILMLRSFVGTASLVKVFYALQGDIRWRFHCATPYRYTNGGWVMLEGYGVDPETIDDIESGLLLVEGLFLMMGAKTGEETSRTWQAVHRRVEHILSTEGNTAIQGIVTEQQDHLQRNYGNSWRGKAHWAEKCAEMVHDLRKSLSERLHNESFMRTLCQWCESEKPSGVGMAFTDCYIHQGPDRIWHDLPEGKSPGRNCYIYLAHCIAEAQRSKPAELKLIEKRLRNFMETTFWHNNGLLHLYLALERLAIAGVPTNKMLFLHDSGGKGKSMLSRLRAAVWQHLHKFVDPNAFVGEE